MRPLIPAFVLCVRGHRRGDHHLQARKDSMMTPPRFRLSQAGLARALMTCMLLAGLIAGWHGVAATQQAAEKAVTPGPMLDDGLVNLDTPEFSLTLVRSSQTVAALKSKPIDPAGFDFTPGDLLKERSQDGYYHLGDLDLRLRSGTSGEWKSYSTAFARRPVTALPTSATVLAAADLSATLPADLPLEI